MYLDKSQSKRKYEIHIRDYCKTQQYQFLDLAKLAMDALCVSVSTVAPESTFNLGNRKIPKKNFSNRNLDQFHSLLSPQIVKTLICTKD